MSSSSPPACGIDVAQDTLVTQWSDREEAESFDYTSEGCEAIVEKLSRRPLECVVLEATGGLEWPLVERLVEADLPVVRLNPKQARQFARAQQQYAKTDRLDAEVLAQFGVAMETCCIDTIDREQRELQALVARRRQLIEMRTAERNRHQSHAFEEVGASLERTIDRIHDELEAIEAAIADRIEARPEWAELKRLLETVPGVGETVTRGLVARLPELGEANRQEIARLAGVAPLNQDSGSYRGARSIQGGRSQVRQLLYMASLSAIRHCEPIRQFYQRLHDKRGKPKKVAIVACMRKLVTILNAIARERTPFEVERALPAEHSPPPTQAA